MGPLFLPLRRDPLPTPTGTAACQAKLWKAAQEWRMAAFSCSAMASSSMVLPNFSPRMVSLFLEGSCRIQAKASTKGFCRNCGRSALMTIDALGFPAVERRVRPHFSSLILEGGPVAGLRAREIKLDSRRVLYGCL